MNYGTVKTCGVLPVGYPTSDCCPVRMVLNGNNLSLVLGDGRVLPVDLSALALSNIGKSFTFDTASNSLNLINSSGVIISTIPIPDKDQQQISISGQVITLSNGGSITLPPEEPIVVTNSNTINLQSSPAIQADVIISPIAGNTIQILPSGLYSGSKALNSAFNTPIGILVA